MLSAKWKWVAERLALQLRHAGEALSRRVPGDELREAVSRYVETDSAEALRFHPFFQTIDPATIDPKDVESVRLIGRMGSFRDEFRTIVDLGVAFPLSKEDARRYKAWAGADSMDMFRSFYYELGEYKENYGVTSGSQPRVPWAVPFRDKPPVMAINASLASPRLDDIDAAPVDNVLLQVRAGRKRETVAVGEADYARILAGNKYFQRAVEQNGGTVALLSHAPLSDVGARAAKILHSEAGVTEVHANTGYLELGQSGEGMGPGTARSADLKVHSSDGQSPWALHKPGAPP